MTYSRDTETLGKLAGDRKALTPVTLAEWVNSGRCPPEALREAGWLVIELKLAAVRAKLGTDVRWAGAEDYRPALDRMEVNADSIVCWWREDQQIEGWDADADDRHRSERYGRLVELHASGRATDRGRLGEPAAPEARHKEHLVTRLAGKAI